MLRPAGSRTPLRVLYLDHCAQLSGGEIALLRLLMAAGRDVDAHVVLGEQGPLREALEGVGVRVTVLAMPASADVRKEDVTPGRLPLAPLLALLRHVLALTALIRRERPDLVHTNSLKSALYGGLAGRLARVPVVWHVRDRIAADYLPRSAVLLVRAAARVLPTAVIANSAMTLDTLRGALPKRVAYAVLDEVLPELPDVAPRPLHRDGPVVLGMVGRLSPWKGQDVFLRALAQLDGQDVRAVLIGSAMFGEADYEASLHALVGELGLESRVEFTGYRSDVPALLATLDVLVHASISPEPFGQVVIEGMAAGVPVVASAEGGPAEIVQDGVDGLLVEPRRPELLAAALRRLVDDPQERARLAARGLETAKRYTPRVVVPQLLAAYDGVARRR